MTQQLLFSLATGSMAMNVALLVAGVVIVLKGADWLTDGAVNIASRFGVSQIVIGLTIVAMGTSMPEFCVSMVSAIKGTPDLAVGNVVGSNIFNTLLIVGCSALVAPIAVKPSSVRRDIPFAVAASLLMLVFCLDGTIGRADAAVLFAGFCLFLYVTLKYAKAGGSATAADGAAAAKPQAAVAKAALLVAVGLVCLIGGSNMFVDNASFVASRLGVSEAVIGLTIVAGGTSLPELATSMVSARKGNSDIAIGNVIGSNVFNILMIVGITGLVQPMHIVGITALDLAVLTGSVLLLWLFSRTKYAVKRWEGAVLALCYAAYLAWLIANV